VSPGPQLHVGPATWPHSVSRSVRSNLIRSSPLNSPRRPTGRGASSAPAEAFLIGHSGPGWLGSIGPNAHLTADLTRTERGRNEWLGWAEGQAQSCRKTGSGVDHKRTGRSPHTPPARPPGGPPTGQRGLDPRLLNGWDSASRQDHAMEGWGRRSVRPTLPEPLCSYAAWRWPCARPEGITWGRHRVPIRSHLSGRRYPEGTRDAISSVGPI
jgi:hypothetical protein